MNGIQLTTTPYPTLKTAARVFAALTLLMLSSIGLLLSVEDPQQLKLLVEDHGPVQLTGLACISLACTLSLYHALSDTERRSAYLQLSYLLLFYALREADYHYRVSEYAKATQFKRFYLHEQIPLSTKLLMAMIIILFLVTLVRYLRQYLPVWCAALRHWLPWALGALAWAGVFSLSQVFDQIPFFHTVWGQAVEEVLEATAEALVLLSLLLFRMQLRAPGHTPA